MDAHIKNQARLRARLFNALSDPLRLEILEFLRGEEKCVCEIIPQVRVVQPLVSRHLRILKDAGLVKYRRIGNRRLYSVTDPKLFKVIDAATPRLNGNLSRNVIEQII